MLLKDDKKYPYLCITWSEAYPRIFITRRRRFRSLDRFYGPYVDVEHTSHAFSGNASFRCGNGDRCRSHLPERHWPLSGVARKKSAQDYHRTLRKVAMVFQGRGDELQQLLQEQMERYAERMDYDRRPGFAINFRGLISSPQTRR